MPTAAKLFAKISRSEFLLPNLGSLIMGLAWGASPPIDPINGTISVVLSFLIINLSSIIGAQANTLYDYKLDLKDERKKELVQALDSFGHKKVRNVMILEILLDSRSGFSAGAVYAGANLARTLDSRHLLGNRIFSSASAVKSKVLDRTDLPDACSGSISRTVRLLRIHL